MGWSGGSLILSDVWGRVRRYVPEAERAEVLTALMHQFSDHDCDTIAEVVRVEWPESQAAYKRYCKDRGRDDDNE